MGAELSVPLSRMPDNTTIFQKTSNTIEAMNRILDFLLINSDVKDMISLGDESKCKNWLILGENKIREVFDKIQISPQRGKDGILYIKKLDVLTKGQDASAQNGCRLLAFFFIRLFQIVGALSLSIIDTKLPDNDYTETSQPSFQTEKGRIPLLKIKEDKPRSFLGMFRGGMFRGGAIVLPTDFIFKEHIIVDPNNADRLNLVNRTRSGTGFKYEPKPGYEIKLINDNNIQIKYFYNDNEISFIIAPSKQRFEIFNILEVQRNTIPIRLSTNSYNWVRNDTGIISVTYDKNTVNFTDFIENYLIREIRTKPVSLIGQILKKYDYIDTSETVSKGGYYQIKNLNISDKGSIQVEINDFLSNPDPTFSFILKTKYENRDINIQVNFKLKLAEEVKDTKYVLQVTDRIFVLPKDFKEESVIFEETEEEKVDNSNSTNVKTDNPYTRRFTVKSGPSVIIRDPTFGTSQTIPKFLELRFKNFVTSFLKELGEGYKKSKRGYLNPPKEGNESELKFVQLWKAISSESPVKAFCTARALQLLDKSGLYSSITPDSLQFIQSTKLPEKITSYVSNSKFPLIQNKSVPGLGQPITSAEGFAALQKLYDTPKKSFVDPSKTDPGFFGLFAQSADADRDKKNLSLEKLIKSFRTDENKLSNTIAKLSDITDIPKPNLSETSFDPRKDMAKLRALRLQAIKLFQIQFDHTRRVNTLLNKIFKIDNKIELRPEILSKGVNGIEEIAQEARDLLTDYYAGCQTEYVIGVKILTNKIKPVVNATANNA